MECERLIKLIKNWYVQVQGEAMAPARMVDFMHNHLETCPVCIADPVVDAEVKKITEIILPAKPAKVVRQEEEAGGDLDTFDETDEAIEGVDDDAEGENDDDVAEGPDEDELDDPDDDDF